MADTATHDCAVCEYTTPAHDRFHLNEKCGAPMHLGAIVASYLEADGALLCLEKLKTNYDTLKDSLTAGDLPRQGFADDHCLR